MHACLMFKLMWSVVIQLNEYVEIVSSSDNIFLGSSSCPQHNCVFSKSFYTYFLILSPCYVLNTVLWHVHIRVRLNHKFIIAGDAVQFGGNLRSSHSGTRRYLL